MVLGIRITEIPAAAVALDDVAEFRLLLGDPVAPEGLVQPAVTRALMALLTKTEWLAANRKFM